jgi:hypothetical protein
VIEREGERERERERESYLREVNVWWLNNYRLSVGIFRDNNLKAVIAWCGGEVSIFIGKKILIS